MPLLERCADCGQAMPPDQAHTYEFDTVCFNCWVGRVRRDVAGAPIPWRALARGVVWILALWLAWMLPLLAYLTWQRVT